MDTGRNLNPFHVSYKNELMEDQCRIVADSWRNQDKEKRNLVKVKAVKKADRITNQGSYFEKILYALSNLQSDTKTTRNSIASILKDILALYTYTIKYAFFHLRGKISEVPYLKKNMVIAHTS